jgi:D-tyrosyl-tRNA(Tyr) deacylase
MVGSVDRGLCALIGAGDGDGHSDAKYIADKIANLRIFPDDDGKMNLSVLDIGGGVLAISQFTLYGDARKGRRPAFTGALEPKAAEALYNDTVALLRQTGIGRVETGVFRAEMQVSLVNEGPVTILLDSRKEF